jgi:murein DD-endopeptidase MepM/ murein hydrolase activator NlpD
MGNYNSEYEDYYSSLKKKNKIRNFPYQHSSYNVDNTGKSKEKYLIRRITRDLIGVLILFIFTIGCKVIVTPQTQTVYNYSKKVLSQNYDYGALKEKSESIDFTKLQDKLTNIIEQIRSKITGSQTATEKIKSEFILPVKGVETSPYGYREDPITKEKKFHAGVDIDAKENTDVLASYAGKVKECGTDGQLGNYILIDHGEGIETKYAHLNKILIKKEDAVKKSQVIAKSGNTGKSTGPHLHFELLYMGENEDPNQYFNIIKK